LKKYQSNHFLFCWRRPRPWFRILNRECNVNCFDFFFCLFDGCHEWKNHIQLNRTA